jgi:maltooligosyltrehalose trehalohydrolase
VTDQPAHQFVVCLQNHDQIGNRAFGERLHHQIDAARYAVASAVLLLAPETPLLFMGQEFAASSPFLYFTDHHEALGRLVTEGRRNEFQRFAAFADPVRRAAIPDPQAESTFLRSKLPLAERTANADVYRLYRDLLRLRRKDPVLCGPDRMSMTAEAVATDVLVLHRWGSNGHRLIVANFGEAARVELPSVAETAPGEWRLALATSWRRYGGGGQRPLLNLAESATVVRMPARTAAVFALSPREDA